MAKAKVKVGIYKKSHAYEYGYDNLDIISEEQFEELVADRVEELKKDEYEFEGYLSDNYLFREIFNMNEDDKAKVREEYANKCVDWARDDLEGDWDYDEIETEVEISMEVPSKQPKGKCPCPYNR